MFFKTKNSGRRNLTRGNFPGSTPRLSGVNSSSRVHSRVGVFLWGVWEGMAGVRGRWKLAGETFRWWECTHTEGRLGGFEEENKTTKLSSWSVYLTYLPFSVSKYTKMNSTVPASLYPVADVESLRKEYVGKSLDEIPTPAFIVNRQIVKKNCDNMLSRAEKLHASFRAHVKTHKTNEGVEYQLSDKSDKVVVSTLMEAWKMKPFYEQGKIVDVLYGLPVVKSRLDELVELNKSVKTVRLMIDHASQLDMVIEYSKQKGITKPWSFFIKVNMGTNRAGKPTESDELTELIKKALAPENKEYLSLYGFYCHAGHSYASSSVDQATDFLKQEIVAANKAAKIAKSIDGDLKLTISVGATPTAHASDHLDVKQAVGEELHGELELHAGNYPFCDYQQMATNCITKENVACTVLAEVASNYDNRGDRQPGEVLINAGVIAMAREPGPLPGWGKVATPGFEDWYVGRLSQEHGILVPTEGTTPDFPELGQKLQIIPQHSCITANPFAWYYVTDGDNKVVDIWGAWRGW